VRRGDSLKRLSPGEQIGTAPFTESPPVVAEEILWSRYFNTYLMALQKAGVPVTRSEFQDVSIHPESGLANADSASLACHGIDGMWRAAGDPPAIVPLGECTGHHATASVLISAAYDVKKLEGGPDWLYGRNAANLGFQLEARAQ